MKIVVEKEKAKRITERTVVPESIKAPLQKIIQKKRMAKKKL